MADTNPSTESPPSPTVLGMVIAALRLSESLRTHLEPRLGRSELLADPVDEQTLLALSMELTEVNGQIATLAERIESAPDEPPHRLLGEAHWGLTAQSLRYWVYVAAIQALLDDDRERAEARLWSAMPLARQARRSAEALAFMVRALAMTGPDGFVATCPTALREMLDLGSLPRLPPAAERAYLWSITPAPEPALVDAGKVPATLFVAGAGFEAEQRLALDVFHPADDDAKHDVARFLAIQRASLERLVEPGADGDDILSALGSAVAGRPVALSGTATNSLHVAGARVWPTLSVNLATLADDNQWYLLDHAQRSLVAFELRDGLGWSQIHQHHTGDPQHALGNSLSDYWIGEDERHRADPVKLARATAHEEHLRDVRERLRAVAAERDREFAALLA